MAESKVGKASKPRIEPSMRSQKLHRRVERLSSQESDQQEEQDMTDSGEEMSSHPPEEPLMETNPPMELWVGFVNDVPLVGTSANMVDGFIDLLLGDREAAEAKGYKDFLEAAGIHELKPGSILQNHESQTVIGCSAEVSKVISDRIILAPQAQISGPSDSRTEANKPAKKVTGAGLYKELSASFDALRDKLKEISVDLDIDEKRVQRSKQGEHVFNKALLQLYRSIIDLFVKTHLTTYNRDELVALIPNSRVSDAYKAYANDNVHINLTAAKRMNIKNWSVYIPRKVIYIPINNTLFGYMIKSIRTDAVKYMFLFPAPEKGEVLSTLARSVDWMRMHRIYLDPQAAVQWLDEHPRLINEFYATEDEVQLMLRRLDPSRSNLLSEFVEELRQAVRLLTVRSPLSLAGTS